MYGLLTIPAQVICSSFYPIYQCGGQHTTLQASEKMACMEECARQEGNGCCEYNDGSQQGDISCSFSPGSFSVAKATNAHKDETSIAFCEAEDKDLVEMHTSTSYRHTRGYSYGYSYGTTGKHAPACICKTSWSSSVGGEHCSEEQQGCTNCDQTSDGSIGWCQVEDTSCATAERGHGPSFYWSYCTTPSPSPPPLRTSLPPPPSPAPPPPPPSPAPPPPEVTRAGIESRHQKSPPPPLRTYARSTARHHPPPPSPVEEESMAFSIAFSLLGLVLGVALAFYALRVLRRSPLLRLLGMRKAANDIEMDLSLRPQNAGQSHEEPTAVGWS